MYLPNYSLSCTGDEVTTTVRDAVMADYQALYTALCQHFNTGADEAVAYVFSRSGAAFNKITGVSVDTVVDVQRRRKNAVKGTRSSVGTLAIGVGT
jgi:hypothetical protein